MKKLIYVIFILLVSVIFLFAQDTKKAKEYEEIPYADFENVGPIGPNGPTDKQIISAIEKSIDDYHNWDKHNQSKFDKPEYDKPDFFDENNMHYFYYSYNVDSVASDGGEIILNMVATKRIINAKTLQEAYVILRKLGYLLEGDSRLPAKLPDSSTILDVGDGDEIVFVKKGSTYVITFMMFREIESQFYYFMSKRSDGFIQLVEYDVADYI